MAQTQSQNDYNPGPATTQTTNTEGVLINAGNVTGYNYSSFPVLVITPQQFGAVDTTGGIDCTTQLQAAINYMTALGGGRVKLGNGTYLHSGLTINNLVQLEGMGKLATILKNNSNNPSILVQYTGTSLLNAGIFGMTLQGLRAATSAQHGLIIDGCSSGYMIEDVQTVQHGGDGIRIRSGSVGPRFRRVFSKLNVGYGLNGVSAVEDPGIQIRSATSAHFMGFEFIQNDLGGIRISGGNVQDHQHYKFIQGDIESNGNSVGGRAGIYLLNGVIGGTFRDLWIEANASYGILCDQDGNGGGQVPIGMTFDEININNQTTNCINVNAGQRGTWRNITASGTGNTATFANLTNADGHEIYGTFPAFASTGRNVKYIQGPVGTANWHAYPGLQADTLYLGPNLSAYQTTGTVTTTNGTPQYIPYFPVAVNQALAFSVLITARRTDAASESAAWLVQGVIARDTTAASTAFVGTPTVTLLGRSGAVWTVAAAAETSNGGVRFLCTGEAAKNIIWNAGCFLTQAP